MKNKLKLKLSKKELTKLILQCLWVAIGTLVMALGYKLFLTPNRIVPGGFMGLAQIIHDLFAKINFTLLSTSVWYILLNIFLFLYAVKVLGFKFGLRAGVGILSYSIWVDLIDSVKFITNILDKLSSESTTLVSGGLYIIYAIYGGILMGVGMGIVFRANGSTGGCDMVAVVVNKFFPNITTGQIVMIVDGAVVVLSAICYNSLALPLYALITIFVCGKVSDVFVDGVKSLRAYYILTDKKDEISTRIINELDKGVTNISCVGMYTHKEKNMLLVILRRSQIMQLKQIVKETDPNSFMFSNLVKEAYGEGFTAYNLKNTKLKSTTEAPHSTTPEFEIKNSTIDTSENKTPENNF